MFSSDLPPELLNSGKRGELSPSATLEHCLSAPSFGERVYWVRRLRGGLSQKQLAALSGVSERTITRFENNNHDHQTNNTQKVAKALGVTVSDLLGDT